MRDVPSNCEKAHHAWNKAVLLPSGSRRQAERGSTAVRCVPQACPSGHLPVGQPVTGPVSTASSPAVVLQPGIPCLQLGPPVFPLLKPQLHSIIHCSPTSASLAPVGGFPHCPDITRHPCSNSINSPLSGSLLRHYVQGDVGGRIYCICFRYGTISLSAGGAAGPLPASPGVCVSILRGSQSAVQFRHLKSSLA